MFMIEWWYIPIGLACLVGVIGLWKIGSKSHGHPLDQFGEQIVAIFLVMLCLIVISGTLAIKGCIGW